MESNMNMIIFGDGGRGLGELFFSNFIFLRIILQFSLTLEVVDGNRPIKWKKGEKSSLYRVRTAKVKLFDGLPSSVDKGSIVDQTCADEGKFKISTYFSP